MPSPPCWGTLNFHHLTTFTIPSSCPKVVPLRSGREYLFLPTSIKCILWLLLDAQDRRKLFHLPVQKKITFSKMAPKALLPWSFAPQVRGLGRREFNCFGKLYVIFLFIKKSNFSCVRPRVPSPAKNKKWILITFFLVTPCNKFIVNYLEIAE
jgi:hypothetical protein